MQKQITEIRGSLFCPITDSSLELIGNDTRAEVIVQHRGHYPSAWELFASIFGQWLQDKILPAAQACCDARRSKVAAAQRRHYSSITYEDLMQYFLIQFVLGAKNSLDQNVDKNSLTAAQQKLHIGETKCKVLASVLRFTDEVFNDIVAAIPCYLARYIQPGGVVVLDEAIWANYSLESEKVGLLRYIPEKPHQRGELSYVLCQRLLHSDRPIAVAFAPTFVADAPTPGAALKLMVASLQPNGFCLPDKWILVADSLWCYPSHIQEIMELGWKFAISMKLNSTVVPKALHEVSSDGLILGHARTYSDKFTILQTYRSDRGISAILSNAFRVRGTPSPPALPALSYETAISLFMYDKPASIVCTYRLPAEAIAWKKERIVHKATGWDVLRPESDQSANFKITREWLTKIQKERVAAIFRSKYRGNSEKKYKKAEMIKWLCPQDNEPEVVEKSRGTQQRIDTAHLTAQLKELQGDATTSHIVYDLFHEYHGCVDEMDKDFYEHQRVRYIRGATHSGLCYISAYLLATCIAISDELACVKVYDNSNRNIQLAKDVPRTRIDHFLCKLVDSFFTAVGQTNAPPT